VHADRDAAAVSAYETLRLAVDDEGIATLTLDRPDALNAVNAELRRDLKNASGVDSAATSHELQSERNAKWLELHGVKVPRNSENKVDAKIEISPLIALEPGDLTAVDLPESVAAGAEYLLEG
jgi:hypothetical protein